MNLKDLLRNSMELEKIQASIYKGLEAKFSFSKEISQFWSSMAEDEKDHYRRITKMYNQLSPEKLSTEVSDELYDNVCKGLRKLNPARLEDVFNLDDACKLASEVEDYETEAVFNFVHSRFMRERREEVSTLILAHLDKLSGFSDKLGSQKERQIIKAISFDGKKPDS